jgi:hypothetical protein
MAAVALIAVVLAAGGCSREATLPKRVLVFGIDGGTWDVMQPMIEAGELPNIAKLYESGLHGVLVSRPPAISPVVWTTIFTGRLHTVHGVDSWATSQSTHRKVKAIWEMVSERGLDVDSFNVPASWPPEELNGVMMSGFPLSGSTLGGNTGVVVTPAGLGDRSVPPVARMNAEVLREAMGRLAAGEWSPWIELSLKNQPKWKAAVRIKRLDGDKFYVSPVYRTDEGMVMSYPSDLRTRIADRLDGPYIPEGPGWSKHAEDDTPKYLYEHLLQVADIQTRAVEQFIGDDWDLFLYVDTFVDRVSHPYWAYSRPDDYDGLDRKKAALYEDAVRNAYKETDRQLGDVLSRAKGSFYTVIVSDHGFQSSVNKQLFIGTHSFDGVYLISGPGLTGEEGIRANIEDVAPTLLYLLGQPVGEDMDGSVIAPLPALVGREVETVASYESTAKAGSDEPVDEKTWEQLRGLGYVDGPAPKKKGE